MTERLNTQACGISWHPRSLSLTWAPVAWIQHRPQGPGRSELLAGVKRCLRHGQ